MHDTYAPAGGLITIWPPEAKGKKSKGKGADEGDSGPWTAEGAEEAVVGSDEGTWVDPCPILSVFGGSTFRIKCIQFIYGPQISYLAYMGPLIVV